MITVTVVAVVVAVLGAISTLWTHREWRRTQQMRAEAELKLAAHSIALKPDEVIPRSKAWPSGRDGQTARSGTS